MFQLLRDCISPCNPRLRWFAIAVAIAVATSVSSQKARAAEAPPAAMPAAVAPSAQTFEGLQVQVVGAGRPVLMIPGLASGAAVWTETCRALQPGVQCHIVQLPGFAGTAPVARDGWLDGMRDRLLDYVADRHLDRPVVMGHSLGGVLALEMAAKSPDRLGRLVIVDALPFLAGIRNPAATADDARQAAEAMRAQMKQTPADQADAQRVAMARSLTRTPAGVDTIVRWGRDSDADTVGEAMVEMWGRDLRPDVARIHQPTLVLGSWAAYQPMGATLESTRGLFEQQYANLKGATVHMSQAGYHFLMWDDPTWLVSEVKSFVTAQ